MFRPRVLFLFHQCECHGIRALDADEDPEEVRVAHETHQLLIIGQIDRSFRREFERVIVVLIPAREVGEKTFYRLLVADQIVVDEVYVAPVAKFVEPIELGEHLLICFGPRDAAVEFDDVAELAGEWTSPRVLHANIEVLIELQKVEARNRRLSNVDGEFFRLEGARPLTPLPGRDEIVDDTLGFAENQEVRVSVEVRA
jgi:hypothetical protein